MRLATHTTLVTEASLGLSERLLIDRVHIDQGRSGTIDAGVMVRSKQFIQHGPSQCKLPYTARGRTANVHLSRHRDGKRDVSGSN